MKRFRRRPASSVGVAIRPTLLFVAAFALNVTPHEAAHAAASYLLGFSSTLLPMWINPVAAMYKQRYKQKPSGLLFLMLAIVSLYMFFGPVAGVGSGSDFNTAIRFSGHRRLCNSQYLH